MDRPKCPDIPRKIGRCSPPIDRPFSGFSGGAERHFSSRRPHGSGTAGPSEPHTILRSSFGRIITRYLREATKKQPAMAKKQLVAHSMRHTTAVHLLQAGVEVNVIRAWLGHASIDSLQPYLDLESP
ncbi:tyrosine-type recombinase/integrase [bacterium]|nr:tyrosine-type recombinase/integrase [bacterium]